MTDVIAIATERRARLVAEIAKLDEFLRMAETLKKYGAGLNRQPVAAADPTAPIVLLSELNAAGSATRPNAPRPIRTEGEGEATHEVSDQFDFSESAPEGQELVLTRKVAGADPDEERQCGSDSDAQVDLQVAQRLRQRRWMLGITKKSLSERSGVSISEILSYEKGDAPVTSSHIWQLASALGVPASYFFDDGATHSTDSHANSKEAQAETGERERVAETA